MEKVIKKPYTGINQNTLALLNLFCVLSFLFFGCKKLNENESKNKDDSDCHSFLQLSGSEMALDCIVSSFLEGVSEYANCNCVYLIKGIVLDSYEYGLKISFVEDLKGNFPENVKTFIAWGSDTNHNSFLNRLDKLMLYKKQDVLIMHLAHARDHSHMTPPGYTWFEKTIDYCTINCAYSVFKISDGIAIGNIVPYVEKDAWWEKMSKEELTLLQESLPIEEQETVFMDKLPWEDIQSRIEEFLLNSNK